MPNRIAPSALIILVNYKRPIDTVACLLSLLQLTYDNWTCVVRENGSGDGSYQTILAEFKEATLKQSIETDIEEIGNAGVVCKLKNKTKVRYIYILTGDSNLGFAGGNNAAIAAISTRINLKSFQYYWFLNNDTVVDGQALSSLIHRMQQSDGTNIGMCGSTLLYYDSKKLVQCFGGAKYNKWTGRVSEIGNATILEALPNRSSIEESLDYISGASILVSYEFIQAVGLMNVEYFLYFEELDWAERGRRKGFKLAYAPNSLVWHREGAVLGSGKAVRRSALAEFYGLRSRLRFTAKFFPQALPSIWLGGCLQLLRRIANGQWENARSLFQALIFRNRT